MIPKGMIKGMSLEIMRVIAFLILMAAGLFLLFGVVVDESNPQIWKIMTLTKLAGIGIFVILYRWIKQIYKGKFSS